MHTSKALARFEFWKVFGSLSVSGFVPAILAGINPAHPVYAMGAPPAEGAHGGPAGLVATFLPLVLIFLVFYFLLIRPQQKRAREHQRFIENLRNGQKVITAGGLIGHVVKVEGDEVLLEVGKDVKVRVQKNYIAGPA